MRRFLKKRFRVTVLVVILLLVGSYAAYRVMLDAELVKQKAQHILSEMLGVDVEVTGAVFHPLSGLYIDEVVVPVSFDGRRQVAAIMHDIHVSHYLASLFTGRLEIREIRAKKLSLYLARDKDGSSNLGPILATLRKRPPTRTLLPTVRVENLKFAYHDETVLDRQGLPLDLELTGVLACLTPRPGQRILEIVVAVDDPDLGRWQIRRATVNVDTGRFELTAESSRLPINESLCKRLGARGREIMKGFGLPSTGTAKLTLYLTCQSGEPQPFQFRLEADVHDMTISPIHFPYRIDNLAGVMVFTPEGVNIQNMKGTGGQASFTFAGGFEGYVGGTGIDLLIKGKRVPIDKKLRNGLNERRRKTFDLFDPSGTVDMTVKLTRPRGMHKHTSVSIDARNSVDSNASEPEPVHITYKPFPYRLKLVGSGTYRDGLVRIGPDESVVATHDENVFAIRGVIDRGDPHPVMDVVIDSRDVKLDADIYKALPAENRRIWDYLQPTGTVGVTVSIKRPDPTVVAADVEVAIDDIRSSFSCRDFPYRIEADAGRIIYRHSSTKTPSRLLVLKDIKGRRDKTVLTINGKLSGFGPETPVMKVDLNVCAKGLRLDDELKKAAPENVAQIWEFLRPTPESVVDADCTFKRTDPTTPGLDCRIRLTAQNVSMECKAFPYRLDHLVGVADFRQHQPGKNFQGGELILTRLSGKARAGTEVEINGRLAGFEKDKPPRQVDLTVRGRDVPLDTKLRSALSPAYGKTFDALRPVGRVDVFCRLERNTTVADEMNTRVLVTTRGNQICYDKMPVPLEDVTGRIEIAGNRIQLSALSGKALGGRVTLSGLISQPGEHATYNLNVRAVNIKLDDGKLPEIIPDKHREFFNKLKPRGRADVAMSLSKKWTSPTEPEVRYKATIQLRGASLEFGAKPAKPAPVRKKTGGKRTGRLSNLNGTIDIVGVATSERDDFGGRLNLKTLDAAGLHLTDVKTWFDKRAGCWGLYDLEAGLYDGRVSGTVLVRRDSWNGFGAVLSLKDIELARVGTELFNMRAGQVRGKLSGQLELQGARLRMKDLVGRAELSVKKGKLWELPIILSLLNVLNIPSLDRTAFNEARANLEIYDRRFHIRQLDLLGNAFSIYGQGDIDADGDINLTFLTGISRLTVHDVPVFGGLLKTVQKQLMMVRVHGTVRDPKLELEPIAPVTGVVKGIISGIVGRGNSDE